MRKRLAMILCGCMAAGLLAACGSTGTGDGGASASAADSAAEAETEADQTPAEDESASAPAEDESASAPAEETFSGELNLYAAASLNGVLTELIGIYNETQPDVAITLSTGSSGDMKDQILAADGVDVDLFFSAAMKQMNTLVEEGLVDESGVVQLLKNEVVLIGAKDSGTAVTGFENITDAKNIALADETVPVGSYSREIFTSLGISVDDFAEVNTCADVSAVKEAVKEGSNEIGTVYYSDYFSVKDDVDLIEIADQSLYSPCIYPVARVINSAADDAQNAAAEDFLAFLQTDGSKEVFKKYMFSIYEG